MKDVRVLSNVIQLRDWYRIPLRHGLEAPLRDYELPMEEYRFLRAVSARLGGKLNPTVIALQSLLVGEIDIVDVDPREKAIVEETARELRMVLPK